MIVVGALLGGLAVLVFASDQVSEQIGATLVIGAAALLLICSCASLVKERAVRGQAERLEGLVAVLALIGIVLTERSHITSAGTLVILAAMAVPAIYLVVVYLQSRGQPDQAEPAGKAQRDATKER